MCVNLTAKVMDVVNSWQIGVKMFTAFDVTKQLRKNGESVAHWEVRDEVRRLFSIGKFGTNCDRQLINVMSASTFVYYNTQDGSDPSQYDPQWLDNVISTPSAPFDSPISSTPTVAPKVGTNVTSQTVAVTSENRLNISSVLLRKIGANPGDFVSVEHVIDQNSVPKIYISKSTGGNFDQKVDDYGRIRLSERTLKWIGAVNTVNKTYFDVHYDNKDNAIYVVA